MLKWKTLTLNRLLCMYNFFNKTEKRIPFLLLLLSNTLFKYFHALHKYFLWLRNIPLLGFFFFFLSMELLGKHLNAFYFVTVINLNNSAVTIFIYESFSIFRTASPRKFPEVGFLGQMIGMSLNLEMYIFPEYFP